MLILDTNIPIDIQRGHDPAVNWFREIPVVPGFVVMELIQDASKSAQVRTALRLVAPLRVVWPSREHFDQALTNFASFHVSHGVGTIDCLIAACAIGLQATLCSFNSKHYRAIPGLSSLPPYLR